MASTPAVQDAPHAGQPAAASADVSAATQGALLRQRRFLPFFLTQFAGAANDNIFKIGFTGLVTFQAARFDGVDAGSAAFVAAAIFILPFVLFSATAGQLADKFDKAVLMRQVKSLEIAIMALAAVGFFLYSAPLLYLCTFLMGLHSTVFGPAKYAYLPQHLQPAELTGGNGLVEMGTFVAILLGTIAGGLLADSAVDGAWPIALGCLAVALAGRFTAAFIPATPAPQPELVINWNPFTETWRNLRLACTDRDVLVALLGISWLWFVGATFLTSFFNFAREVLGADAQVVTLLLALFSMGIGVGALACERLSGRRIELGLAPLGALGMTLFAVDLWWVSQALPAPAAGSLATVSAFLADPALWLAHWRIMADLFLLALCGGLYSVPLYAWIQARSLPTHRARIIAANNILNALFMIVSSLAALALFAAGGTIPQLFLATALLGVGLNVALFAVAPEYLRACRAWLCRATGRAPDRSQNQG